MTQALFSVDAAKEIMTDMLGLQVGPWANREPISFNDELMYTATVCLSGAWIGAIHIQLSEATCRTVTCAMLMMEPDEVTEDDMFDALGEIANMASGTLKSRVAEPTATSLPAVGSGRNLKIRLKNAKKIDEIELVCEGAPVSITVWEAPQPTSRFNKS